MKWLKLVLFVAFMISLMGCLDNTGSDTKPIVEPGGSADFYINNQSGIGLNLVYGRLGDPADSLKTIPQDSSTRICRVGTFGSNPTPSRSLGKVVFYKGSPDSSTPAFTIDPVKDDPWGLPKKKDLKIPTTG